MSIRTRGKKLVIDFRFYLPDGRRVRCVESEGPDTPENRKRVELKHKGIEYALQSNTFDYLKFFPHGSKAPLLECRNTAVTFGQYYEQHMREKEVRSGSESHYQSIFRTHLAPVFGHMPLSAIGEEEVLSFRRQLSKTVIHRTGLPLKETTINGIILVLCQILRKAHRKGLISVYPCEDIGKLKTRTVDIAPFAKEEISALLRVMPGEWQDMLIFWVSTGLRVGEICALEWKHIDWINAKAMIRQNLQYSGEIGPPKTQKSQRDVDLSPSALSALKRQRARTGLQDQWIWQYSGQRMYHRHIQKRFAFFQTLAGVARRPPGQLRHTFASAALQNGENVLWVSQMMGHETAEMTLRRYARYIRSETRRDGSALEEGLFGKPEQPFFLKQGAP